VTCGDDDAAESRARLNFCWRGLVRRSRLEELQFGEEALQDPSSIVVLGGACRNCLCLVVQLGAHLLLRRVNPRHHAVQHIQTRLKLSKSRGRLLRCFSHRVEDEERLR
jgi:hypothetical protein